MLNESLNALASIGDTTERAKLATELFGKAGTELAPILNSGTAGIADLKQEAHDLGLVMSNESVTSGVELGDTIENLKDSFGAIGTKLAVDLMPVIQQVADYITAHMPEIQAVIQTVFDVVGSVIEAIKPIITGLISIISDVVTSAQTEGTAFNDIWKGIQAVFESVIAIIKSVFKAFDSAFKGDWSGFWNAILNILKGFISLFTAAGKAIFTALWDGLKAIWTDITTWVSQKVQWIIDKFTAALSFGSSVTGSSGGGGRSGSHRNGLEEVPYDGYIAELHKGEMVLTAAEANQYQSGMSTLINALTAATSLSSTSGDTSGGVIQLVVNVGGEKFGEQIVSLGDAARTKLGIAKVVKV